MIPEDPTEDDVRATVALLPPMRTFVPRELSVGDWFFIRDENPMRVRVVAFKNDGNMVVEVTSKVAGTWREDWNKEHAQYAIEHGWYVAFLKDNGSFSYINW